MPEIIEWVYRNGAESDPEGCGDICEALWSAEQHVPDVDGASALWQELGQLMTATGLWGEFAGGESFHTHPYHSTIGWLIKGPSPKWMNLPVPLSLPDSTSFCAEEQATIERATYIWSPEGSSHEPLGETGWVLSGCYVGFNGIFEYDEAQLQGCPGTEAPSAETGEWKEKRWIWSTCSAWVGGHREKTSTYVVSLHTPIKYGPVEEYVGGDERVTTTAGDDPGSAVIQTLIEDALGEAGELSAWVDWVLEGGHGEEPLGRESTTAGEEEGSDHESAPGRPGCYEGFSVNCATGNETKGETDLSVGGRGPALSLTRTYNSQLAARESSPGPFGYGWTSLFSAHVEAGSEPGTEIVRTSSDEAVRFFKEDTHWVPDSPLVEATLAQEGEAFVFTLPDQTVLRFGSSGYLESETDRNGNALTVHGTPGHPESISDAAGRSVTFSYDSEDFVESATDPMGHTVKYAYEGGNLTSVTEAGQTSPRWRFKYNSEHELTDETDGRGNTTERVYDSSHRVTSETDAMGHTRKWEYAGSFGTQDDVTTIDEPDGAATRDEFDSYGLPTSVTRGYGTSLATTTRNDYNALGQLVSSSDPDGYTTLYTYDAAGNRTSARDPEQHERRWTYDSKRDVTSETTPDGETTSIERDSHGNPISVSRPAPGGETQISTYKYGSHGDLESVTDPLEHTWHYEYDGYGDRVAEIDPEGDERTWGYNEDSQVVTMVSPRGHASGAEASRFTTTIERDAEGRPVKVTNPLKDETEYAYNADGDLEVATDPEDHKTTYTYDADEQPVKVEEPDGTVTETEYDDEGRVIAETDGREHTTKYVRNALGEVTEEVDPLDRVATKEYDSDGALSKTIDAAGRTTTYTYDPAGMLTKISYSSGTPTVRYEYNGDGERTRTTDGTGTSTYTYDQLDRLTQVKDGHDDTVGYEYDLDDEPTTITYPNGKTVTREYDSDGRLDSLTDWQEGTTRFSYDAGSDLTTTTFPASTGDVDSYSYDDADAISEVKMQIGSETLASLDYTRNSNQAVTKAATTNLPGAAEEPYTYDEDGRLATAGTTKYGYDAANDVTHTGEASDGYDAADELESSTTGSDITTYEYSEVGMRTKTEPPDGPTTTYGYDQASDLTSVARAKEGEVPAIEDSYAYNGEGLRTSETISGATSYLTWDEAAQLPDLLSNGKYSFIYGPSGLPVEQINNSTGTVEYLHHDQQGSTRLLTGSTGTVTGKCSYSAYGTPTCEGSATTPLGWDGQYTSSDTGLVYLRNRVYDPATAQFLSVDPLKAITGEPYSYAGDNPVNSGDPSGLSNWNPFSESFWTEGNVISESPFNPIPYYEAEISSYENGCGYFASVTHGLEGAVAGAALFAGGEGEDEAGEGIGIAENSAGHIFRDAPGHLAEDTPENRALIEGAVNRGNYVGTHEPGVSVYRETLPNGTQIWAEVYNGEITNGGLNATPR